MVVILLVCGAAQSLLQGPLRVGSTVTMMRAEPPQREGRGMSRLFSKAVVPRSYSVGSTPRRRRREALINGLSAEQRKRVVRALISMDKGEFRWELLTPWVRNRELTRGDKVVIGMTFVTMAIAMQAALEPATPVTQHLSYVANFFSYTIGNQVGYRIIAIVASALEIAAYDEQGFSLRDDAIPEGYNFVFILVNLYYVMRWMLNRIDTVGAAILSPTEEELFSRCFEPLGVGPYQFLKLLDLATWTRPTAPTALTVEGEPVRSLFVSIDGDFDVMTGGRRVASIPPFQIIGEVAALENLQSDGSFHQAARATVLAEPNSLYVSWTHEQLYRLQDTDVEFARAITLAISRTLSHKLGSARKSTGRLITSSGDDTTQQKRDMVAVLPVVAPDQERIFASCFLRRGFDDDDAFLRLVRLAQTSPENRTQVVGANRMLALAKGTATAYTKTGLKVQTFSAPQLVGPEAFLPNLLVFSPVSQLAAQNRRRRRRRRRPEGFQDDDAPVVEDLIVRLAPDAEIYAWDLKDLLPLVRADPLARANLNRLWASIIRDAPQKTQDIIAELPKFSSQTDDLLPNDVPPDDAPPSTG